MKQVMQFAAGTILCFALISCWDRATAQQPIAPEAFNPAVLRPVERQWASICSPSAGYPPASAKLRNPRQQRVPGSRSQLHSWCHQSHPDN
jgi:hypothetical protein